MPAWRHRASWPSTAASRPVTVDPATVPKAMDITTPAGVSQATELDYTVNQPVTIQGVFIPT
jgi:glucoamylase